MIFIATLAFFGLGCLAGSISSEYSPRPINPSAKVWARFCLSKAEKLFLCGSVAAAKWLPMTPLANASKSKKDPNTSATL